MKCLPCGQDNASSALFCTACRRPLVAPTKLPTRLEPLAQPAMAAAAPAMAAPHGGGRAEDFQPSRNRFAPPNAGRTSRLGADGELLTDGEAWAAFIGGSNTDYYLERFERLANGDSGGWNWASFFLRVYWMLYRKMWLSALIWYFVPGFALVALLLVCAAIAKAAVPFALIAWGVGYVALPGMKGNAWYYKHCEKKIRAVRARGGSKDQMLARIEAAGGTSGIALILLAVFGIIALIGILAAVALPAYQGYTVKAKVAQTMPVGADVAAAVGRQYEQTGQLPGQNEVDNFVLQAAHHSTYVTGVDLDGTSGTLTVHVLAPPVEGTYQMVPSADNNHHLSWTCSSPDKLSRYVPASCRPDGAPTR